MQKQIITILILFILAIFLLGCTTTTDSTNAKVLTSTNNSVSAVNTPCSAASIKTFASADEGDLIRFYFIMQGNDSQTVTCDGVVSFNIIDDFENELYSNTLQVSKSNFVDYQFNLTGVSMGKAYEWRVNKSDIKKSYSLSGNGNLIFTAAGTNLNAETYIFNLTQYTDEEMEAISEEEYLKTAIDNTQTISKENFKVTIKKSGFFESTQYYQKIKYYRIDMEVENIGSEADYFSPSGLALIIDSSQYDSAYGGTIETFKNMHPGIKQVGYILFEDVPEDFDTGKLVFETSGFSGMSYQDYKFEYTINNN